jgi:hypothetical protein
MERVVQPEILDHLPARDLRALRSRRDIRRLNAWMGHHRIMARALDLAFKGKTTRRVVELGAGDGHFLLRVARRLSGHRQDVEAILVDRLDVFDIETRGRFNSVGWRVSNATADALDWLRQSHTKTTEIILCNLLLHQFLAEQLAELLHLASGPACIFIALEPRRAWWPLFCSRSLWLVGCSSVTRHDGPVSVRAGFAGRELSALWPDGENWEFTERPAGLFSHLFIAQRKD